MFFSGVVTLSRIVESNSKEYQKLNLKEFSSLLQKTHVMDCFVEVNLFRMLEKKCPEVAKPKPHGHSPSDSRHTPVLVV